MLAKIKALMRSHKMLTLMSNGSSAVIGLVTYGLVARVLNEAELGIWAFFLTLFTLYDMSRTGLLSNAMIKMWGESDDEEVHAVLLGSSWQLAGITSLAGALLGLIGYAIYPLLDADPAFRSVSLFFGGVVLLSLPQTVSMWLLNARMQFERLLFLRFLVILPYLVGVGIIYWHFGEAASVDSVEHSGLWRALPWVFIVYLSSFALASLACMLLGWSGVMHFGAGERSKRKALLHFGKFSMGTLVSSNLLKSSDTFLLLIMRGPVAVAIYNIPERLLGILEIPVRSMVQATYPKLTRLCAQAPQDFRKALHAEAGLLSLLILPMVAGVFLFSDQLVVWLGGEKYAESAGVLKVFAVYMAFVPLDRYAGVSMDALGKPELNFRKVVAMLLVNVAGDLLVLWMGGGVFEVALVSVLTFSFGVLYGFILLRKDLQFNPLLAIVLGWEAMKKVRVDFLNKK